MPHGNVVESQFVRTVPPQYPPAKLLLAVPALLGLALAVLWFSRLGLVTSTADRLPHAATPLVRPILYGTVGLLAFLMLQALLQLIDIILYTASRRNLADLPQPPSVEHFIESAGRLHIESQIARETFQLLAGLLPDSAVIEPNDDLRKQLHLTDHQIASSLALLPELCGRSKVPVEVFAVQSVYDLLSHIESAPKAKGRLHDTRSGAPDPAPANSPASPHADLQNASPRDSRFRTRAHFSGVKRRASDYSGPYRRATDRPPLENYAGPFRRASDSPSTEPPVLGQRDSDRRVQDRRGASAERPAISPLSAIAEARLHRAAATDTSLLNRDDAVIEPVSQRTNLPTPIPPESGALHSTHAQRS